MKYTLSLFSTLIISTLFAQTTVTVSTPLEFLKAIGSNKTIYLNEGEYVLTKHVGEGSSHVSWENEFDGGQMMISNVSNLKVIGKQNSRVLVDPQYTWVMKLVNCTNITLENYTMGHTNGGYCTGGVVYLDSCKNVKVTNCRMFGSGTYGMGIYNSANVTVDKCDIFKCTYGLLLLDNSTYILFTHTRFRETGEFDLITITDCVNLHFKTCIFEKNTTTDSYYESTYFFRLGGDYYSDYSTSRSRNITVNNCVFRDNQTSVFSDDYGSVITLGDNHFERNYFTAPVPTAYRIPVRPTTIDFTIPVIRD